MPVPSPASTVGSVIVRIGIARIDGLTEQVDVTVVERLIAQTDQLGSDDVRRDALELVAFEDRLGLAREQDQVFLWLLSSPRMR